MPREQAALAKTILTFHALPADQTKHELAFDLSKSKSVDQLFKEQTQSARSVYFVHYSQVQASINWFYKSSVINESEAAITTAFNQYFGGDMSSVVFQNIREAKALAYSTYAVYNSASMRNKPNIMMGYVGTQADKFHDAIGSMN